MSGWGPEGRRAAVSISFHGLASGDELAHGRSGLPTVSPALPTLLTVLIDRDLTATWFVDADVAEAEPMALGMISIQRHELACLAGPEDLDRVVAALAAEGVSPVGLRPVTPGAVPDEQRMRAVGLRYVSVPTGSADGPEGGLTRLPYDPELSDGAFLGLDGRPPRGPHAWHQALQVAVGQALERGDHLCLTFHPGLLERRDALAIAVETLNLVKGLERAGRVWIAPLAEVAIAAAA